MQYYVYLGGQKFVDLGLGTHRVKCRVHNEFRYALFFQVYCNLLYLILSCKLLNFIFWHVKDDCGS